MGVPVGLGPVGVATQVKDSNQMGVPVGLGPAGVATQVKDSNQLEAAAALALDSCELGVKAAPAAVADMVAALE